MDRMNRKSAVFWAVVGAAALLKLALVFQQSVTAVFGLHDDYLYLERAAHLLSGEGLGPYNSRTLVKYPGFSFYLALTGLLGLPYLLLLNALYVGGGLYLCAALRKAGVPAAAIAVGAILYFFDPFTFQGAWTRIVREPLTTMLLGWLAGALLFVLVALGRARLAGGHLAVLAAALALGALLREEDVLLYAIPVAAFAAALWRMRAQVAPKR